MVTYFIEKPDSTILMDFSGLKFIYPDYALMILCSIKHLEDLGIKVSGTIRYSDNEAVGYLSRMRFFSSLSVKIPQSLKREYPDSFVHIQEYNEGNQVEVLESILRILRANSDMEDDVYASLDYCFNEVLDNVLNHSTKDKGWVVGQYFPNLNSIRLMVCDYGIGIREALKEKYNFSGEKALLSCIEEGVTNGKGQGHGLFATSEFIKMNKGWLSIISGEYKLDYNENRIIVTPCSNWQGTCVYMRINTNIKVDYKKFTGKYYDYKEHLFGKMFT
ncbi:Histidine kinase-, DNA gyrase B-, and HSP90-like ATPase [Pseudozobellia thermophila]|uniref:Histidine kinase-, DNA gyrase B-, and HSP90-like ATPase n=2 Tax=Pseudozobellia thermophila TaxID=192903 RepID=A0A1M6C8D9_9FLAO|nr:Histidine kinase-, DNA gyrase B-, and HSP90-like ATPase [Pseudozobellia thermophila]